MQRKDKHISGICFMSLKRIDFVLNLLSLTEFP